MVSKFRLLAIVLIIYAVVVMLMTALESLRFQSSVSTQMSLSTSDAKSGSLPLPMVTGGNYGRLGNRMFAYAALYGIARHKNRDPVLPSYMSDFLNQYFQGLSIPTLSDDLDRRTIWEERTFNLQDAKSAESSTLVNVRYGGYPESWQYFHDFRENVLKEFEFQAEITLQAQIIIHQAKEQFFPLKKVNTRSTADPIVVVGVHVRRGDYALERNRIHVSLPGKEYYAAAMNYFVQKYQNVVFIVTSDDIEWCVENLFSPTKNKKPSFWSLLWGADLSTATALPNAVDDRLQNVKFLVETSKQDGAVDLAVLADCDHVIFGFGTFGFWGAYLSAGSVIYCSDCVLNNSLLLDAYGGDLKNFVLPTWIGIERNGAQSASI